ncbi:hypothetical protein GA0070618_2235 [Micromonospora echinospora]|uniref:Uncharacterized protein n=1 Tax=Micromonospora echinospora TaxID=1877 RepID=A0A1C4WJ24_MICEC|nr:hypothetical protein [Micromonospora echinospora]SCE96164.1 hypothetical protein GA0070618_2235 [Micromonospora echinospora]
MPPSARIPQHGERDQMPQAQAERRQHRLRPQAHPPGQVLQQCAGAALHLDRPVPHLNEAGGLARMVPADQHTPDQRRFWRLTEQLMAEVKQADTVLLGLPLYSHGRC